MHAELKLRYIHHWIDHAGRRRYRFRRNGHQGVELPVDGDPNSPEFLAVYFAALKNEKTNAALAAVAAKAGSGTVATAVEEFLASTTFKDVAASTQALRRPILKRLLKPGIGELPLTMMDAKYIERWLEGAPTRGAKKTRLLALKPFFAWAHETVHLIEANPVAGIKVKVAEGRGHHTWTDAEIEQYRRRHPPNTRARLALELLLAVAARRGDAIALGRQHLRDGGWLVFSQMKNRKRKPVTVEMPLPETLKAAIKACPSPSDSLTFLVNEWGKPFSSGAFGAQFRKWCDEAGLPEHCVPHGLRKAACRIMAENDCTAHEIMSISGHTTLKEVERYTKAADRKRLAARAQAKVAAGNNVVPLAVVAGKGAA
jgi:integrase